MQLSHPLVSPGLELRQLQPSDATPRYLGWLSDPEVTRFLETRHAPPRETAELAEFIAACIASSAELLLGMFAEGLHIGNIKLGPVNPYHGTAEIGLLIGERSHWGRGHATTAISLLADHAFGALGLAKLTAGCYAGNSGSTAAFLKAGFVLEGRRALQWAAEGGRQDGILLGRVNPSLSP